jgi:ABC-type amino acid transport substrate-binding protein
MGGAARQSLSATLKHTYRNDRRLLALQPLWPGTAPQPLLTLRSEPVTLVAIRARGVLRLGVRSDGMPWAFRNGAGRLVGFDIDLAEALARSLGVKLQVVERPLAELGDLLDHRRIDLALGGIQSSPQRAIRYQVSLGYESVHLALVVPDGKVGMVQNLDSQPLGRPLRLAVTDPQLITPSLAMRIAAELNLSHRPLPLQLVPIASKQDFFSPNGQRGFDALLTTAEGGSAWAVLYPRTTLLASFGDRLTGELVMLVAGDDPDLNAYLDAWIRQEEGRGVMGSLFEHWIDLDADPKGRDGVRQQESGL